MNGILVVNKDIGYTSRDIVNIVSKHLGTKKVGHTGTLDPMASGVLVLCINQGLKLCELLTNHDKEYIAGVTLGIETDTLDMDGKILKKEDVYIDDSKIIDVVKSFKKTYFQEVPKYSAVKVNGKKLYEYARAGIDVLLPKKEVTIYDINIIDNITRNNDHTISFKIKCTVSSGTYIRSLIRDIGNDLKTIAVMNSLVRTRLGNFNLQDAYSIDDIKKNNYNLISIMDANPLIQRINVNDELAFKIKNGCILDKFFDNDLAFILDKDNRLLALYKNEDNKCIAYRVFQ